MSHPVTNTNRGPLAIDFGAMWDVPDPRKFDSLVYLSSETCDLIATITLPTHAEDDPLYTVDESAKVTEDDSLSLGDSAFWGLSESAGCPVPTS